MPSAICQHCFKPFEFKASNSTGTFCGQDCYQADKKHKQRDKLQRGEIKTRGHIKKHLIDLHGRKCMTCSHSEWMGQPVPLELDHINGDASNNGPDNVRLLCPNCHALTPTHKAKNKGNGRGSRGLPWY